MAIRVEPSGSAELYGGLARLAGESIVAQKEMERAERNAQAMREHQWNMERIQLDHQWDIEAHNRLRAWDIEKMEQASRLDFAREEKERQETLDEYNVKKKAIMDSDILNDKEKQLWVLQLETKLPLAASYMKPQKTVFTPGQIQRGIGELTKYEGILDRPQVIQKAKEQFGEDIESTAPEVMNYINQKFPETAPTAPAEPTGGIGTWLKQLYYGPQYYEKTRGTAPVIPAPSTAPATSVRIQSAPDVALDSYWSRLTNEQKEKVWAAFNNGHPVNDIIRSLGVR